MTTDKVQGIFARLEPLLRNVPSNIIVTPSSPSYNLHAEPFSADKHLHPPIVFVPETVDVLSTIVAFLYKSDLDFNVRGRGFKGASAHDVVISMIAFDEFRYDKERKLATIGVGNTWVDVVRHMEKADPEYSIAVARTPAVGVGGTIVTGGLSWLSTEYGCTSDPINFIDAEVVKRDGSVIMASTEPELLWALRGGGGGFGVMTKIILRAHYYPTNIWSGMILIPRHHFRTLASDIEKFIATEPHPRVTFFVFIVKQRLIHTILEPGDPIPDNDVVMVHAYDALGEKHGREAFRWALEKEGAIDRTRVTNSRGIVEMQHNADIMKGKMKAQYAPMAIPSISQSEIIKAIDWYDNLATIDKKIQELSVIVFEFLVTRTPLTGISETAWARPIDMKHLLLIIASAPADSPKEEETLIRDLLLKAPQEILGEKGRDAVINPAGLEKYHDVKHTYGAHYNKLVELRKKYDPVGRFKGLVNP